MPEDSQNPISPAQRSFSSDPKAVGHFAATASEDSLLLARVHSGDQNAMATLFDRYSSMVYSVALRVLKDPAQAEDVMQEIFIRIWRNPEAFESARGSFASWLAVVARNRAIDSLRRRRPSDAVEDVVLISKMDTASDAEHNVLIEKVRILMRDLPPEQRASVELAFFDGLTHSEIAEKTGEALGTIKTRIRLALGSLRKALRS
jgi:RNA polymerase sigma-70 factor, ECF subfamily